MQAKKGSLSPQDLYRMRLDQNLNEKHPLFRLANAIDWEYFVREFGLLYVENKGRSAKETKKLKIYLGRVTRDI